MTTTDDSMARYTKSETATFTFIGLAESDTAADLLDKVEECLIGHNLQPQQGVGVDHRRQGHRRQPCGAARHPHRSRLQAADLDPATRAALAMQLADSIEKVAPDFDREHFIKAAQPDTDG